MRKISLVMALAAVVALCSGASAQQVNDGQKMRTTTAVPTSGWNPADTTGHIPWVDERGIAHVTEAYPAAGYTMIAPAFLSSAFLHCQGVPPTISGVKYVIQDSSSVEDTQGFNRLGLLVYSSFDADTGASALFAYSIRIHQSASHDTLSTYNLPKIRTLTAPSDTVGSFLDRLESAAVNDSVGTFPYERLLVLNHMNGPRGIFIPLTDRDGANIGGNKISVSWRHIRSYTTSGSGLDPLLRGKEIKTIARADLVGRRD